MRPDMDAAHKLFISKGMVLEEKQFTMEGHTLHVCISGDSTKPLLAIVHGSPGSWEDYKTFMQDSLLRLKYRIAAVDRPGFGASEYGQPMVSLRQQADLIFAALDKLSPTAKIILAGHSYGGPVVTRIAMDHPERIAHLYLLAAAVDPAQEKKEWFRPVVRGLGFMLPDALEASNDELSTLKTDLELMLPLWPKLTMPVTMLHGTEDMLVPYANTSFVMQQIGASPRFRLVSIPKANHFIPWSHFELVRQALLGD